MAKVAGTGATGPSRKPAPKKKAAPKAAAKKAAPKAAAKKAAAAVKKATYQVPKKLIAHTKANMNANKNYDKKLAAKYNREDMAAAKKKLDAVRTNALKKPAASKGQLDEMAQGNATLKRLWEKKNRLNSK